MGIKMFNKHNITKWKRHTLWVINKNKVKISYFNIYIFTNNISYLQQRPVPIKLIDTILRPSSFTLWSGEDHMQCTMICKAHFVKHTNLILPFWGITQQHVICFRNYVELAENDVDLSENQWTCHIMMSTFQILNW